MLAPREEAAVGGVILLGGDDGTHGWELWRTDGTADGTYLVKDGFPGPGGGLSD